MSASNTLKDPCSACLVNKVGRTFHPSRVHSLPPQPHPSKVPGMATSPATVILVVDESPDVPVVRPTILSSSTNSIKTFSQSFGQACKHMQVLVDRKRKEKKTDLWEARVDPTSVNQIPFSKRTRGRSWYYETIYQKGLIIDY